MKSMVAIRLFAVLLVVLPVLSGAQATELIASANVSVPVPDAAKVDLLWGARIPLRDGLHLSATVYRPRQGAPAPCIFTLTPYVGRIANYHDRGIYFAAHGYPFLLVEARGRGNSEGAFQPFIQEAKDGYDVVEWLAHQPYCNGKVAMWGGSYAGYDQWATAKERPPHLATIVPAAASHANVDLPVWPADMQWLTFTAGRTSQDNLYLDQQFWAAKLREWHETGKPLNSLDTIVGNPSATFHEWLSHPQPDVYWDRYSPTPEQYAKLSIPILSITGSYDTAGLATPAYTQLAALTYFREHMRNAPAVSTAHHYLIIGPWDHAGTRTPRREVGGLRFGEASLLDLNELHLEWYAWTMQSGPKPSFLEKSVAYYVMGAEKWCYADTLDSVTKESHRYFLDSTANPTDVFAAGTLRPQPSKGGRDHYVYDPRDTSHADLESKLDPDGFITDQSMVFAQQGKELIYHTAPFDADVEVSGFFRLSAWISIDQPDTDFGVTVYEILPGGQSIQLTSDRLQARYREGPREPKLVTTRAAVLYEFTHFNFVSRQIGKGSRLRLVVAPVNSINSQKNFNSGGVVSAESMQDARTVTVTVYHDPARPSALYVPFGGNEICKR